MSHPLILVPTSAQKLSGKPTRLYFNRAYGASIERRGGIVLGVARPDNDEALDQLISLADGLYLTGGTDMDTTWYNAKQNPDAHNDIPDIERDTLELALLTRALKKEIPILGICRGMQTMNVYFGGTLYQDLKLEWGKKTNHDNREVTDRKAVAHPAMLPRGTQYSAIVEEETIGVNSMHHQGIKDLGKGLTIAARADDGLIEAIELADYPFCIGVQWHPEELHDAPSEKLFTVFIEACKTYQETKTSRDGLLGD